MSQPRAQAITPNDFDTFGELVRYLRERAELSQRELAAQVGYHFTYLSRVERNERTPEATTLMARFIPALGLEDQPQWTARLLKLAARNARPDAPPAASAPKPDLTPQIEAWPGVYPVSLTQLLGRAAELDTLQKMIESAEIRLITLVGPPGVGKSRLAIETANEVSGVFAHGVLYVQLAHVHDVDGFLNALAEELRVPEMSDIPLLHRLAQVFRHKNLLLVLDNFEQLVESAPQVHTLLVNAPQVKALVTSREPLHLAGEHEFAVMPFDTPETQPDDWQNLLQFPVIQLFLQRARAVQPEFQLTAENSLAVMEICRSLDGLPLAIELAAARVKTLPPQSMLKQLDRRFDWLAPNKRDAQSARQSLHGAIEWSYNLLPEKEQVLFRRLSVFSNGRTLETVEAVCADPEPDDSTSTLRTGEMLDLLIQLVDKSLLISETFDDETHFFFFETIHEFARRKLEESGEAAVVRDRHLAYYCRFAERAEYELERIDQVPWANRCETEHDNLRAALQWSLKEGADFETGARLVGAISLFWGIHSHFVEGVNLSRVFLQRAGSLPEAVTAKLLYRTANLYRALEQFEPALELAGQGVELCRKIRNKPMLAFALHVQGEVLQSIGESKSARSALQEVVALCREFHYPELQNISLSLLGMVLYRQGEHIAARATLREGLAIAERLSDQWGIAFGTQGLAVMRREEGKFDEARISYERCLEAAQSIGDKRMAGDALASLALVTNIQSRYSESGKYASQALTVFQSSGDEERQPFPLRMMGYAAIHAGNYVRARVLILESLRGNHSLGNFAGQLASLVALAESYLAEKKFDKAVLLCAAVEPQLGVNDVKLLEPDGMALQRVLKQARKRLGKPAFDMAYEQGRQFKAEELIAELLCCGVQQT